MDVFFRTGWTDLLTYTHTQSNFNSLVLVISKAHACLRWNVEEFRSQQHKKVFHIEWKMIVIERQQLWNKSFSYHLKFKCLEDQQKILIHSGVHVLLLKSKRIVRKQLTGNKFKKHNIPIFKGPNTLNTRFSFSNTNSSFWLHTLPVSMLWIPSGHDTFGALDANNQYCSKASFWNKFQTKARIEKTDGKSIFSEN